MLIDLDGITLCETGSLYTILGVRHAANQVGGSLAISAASGPVRDALHEAGLHEILPVTTH
ncbi:STAS domain-containing protein [Streptomyces sp. NPDC048172]|uniref:STAS domain-containing protein n=1 Tax=Streptomyces sp. NPDC048172 TaxID=3365505 RepID=UPI00371E5F08